ncbi:hypothetical protein JTB14_017075 [Gonioctena quinquepunctata]|nr:hypothetical protein JTB14_017075 [Gonioctena quinquepunctata]
MVNKSIDDVFPKALQIMKDHLDKEHQEYLSQCDVLLSKEPIPGTSRSTPLIDDGFRIPNKRSRIDNERFEKPPQIVTKNSFAVLSNSGKKPKIDQAMEQKRENINPTNKPPPIFIREK